MVLAVKNYVFSVTEIPETVPEPEHRNYQG